MLIEHLVNRKYMQVSIYSLNRRCVLLFIRLINTAQQFEPIFLHFLSFQDLQMYQLALWSSCSVYKTIYFFFFFKILCCSWTLRWTLRTAPRYFATWTFFAFYSLVIFTILFTTLFYSILQTIKVLLHS